MFFLVMRLFVIFSKTVKGCCQQNLLGTIRSLQFQLLE